MKNTFKLFAAALAFVGLANVASAQNTASATGTATARIVEPISISATDGVLRFGNIVSDVDGGSVSVNYGGTASYSGIVALSGWYNGYSTSATSAAGFSVSGEPYFHYIISLPSSVSMTSGENSMTCSLWNPYHEELNTVIDNVGYDTFSVGGTLAVGPDQANGSYSGTFTCTVSYE